MSHDAAPAAPLALPGPSQAVLGPPPPHARPGRQGEPRHHAPGPDGIKHRALQELGRAVPAVLALTAGE